MKLILNRKTVEVYGYWGGRKFEGWWERRQITAEETSEAIHHQRVAGWRQWAETVGMPPIKPNLESPIVRVEPCTDLE